MKLNLPFIDDISEFKSKYLEVNEQVCLIFNADDRCIPLVEELIQEYQHKADCFYRKGI